MNLFQLRCPNCNSDLEVRDDVDSFYCTYCGTKLLLDGRSNSVIEAKVRIKEMEYKERTQDRKYKNEEARWKRKHQEKKSDFVRNLILILIGIVFFFFVFYYAPEHMFDSEEKKHDELVAMNGVYAELVRDELV